VTAVPECSIAVPTEGLVRALRAVAPLADRPPYLGEPIPALTGVHVRYDPADPGVLVVEATDRYVARAARVPARDVAATYGDEDADGPIPAPPSDLDVILPCGEVDALIDVLTIRRRGRNVGREVSLNRGNDENPGDTVAVFMDAWDSIATLAPVDTHGAKFPAIRDLFRGFFAGAAAATPIVMDLGVLRAVLDVADSDGGPVVVNRRGGAVVVTVGDWFVGAAQGMTASKDGGADGFTSAALPGTWQAWLDGRPSAAQPDEEAAAPVGAS
jgi:hypothetical protein